MPWVWLSVVWISCASAVGYGLFVTKNPNCLWALLIPTFIGFSNKSSDGKRKCDDDGEGEDDE